MRERGRRTIETLERRIAPMASWLVERLRGIACDRSGAGAIEFAFAAPIFLCIYISAFEVTAGFTTARNVLKAAGTIADVVTRQPSVDKAYLDTMLDVATATVAPHSATGMKLRITGITIDSAGSPKVLWSWDQDGNAPYTVGSAVSVPSDMRSPSSFLVRSELSLPHQMLLFLGAGTDYSSQSRSITIHREFFYRQRLGDDIPCGDCS